MISTEKNNYDAGEIQLIEGNGKQCAAWSTKSLL